VGVDWTAAAAGVARMLSWVTAKGDISRGNITLVFTVKGD
jgi:hypothetical protein